MIEPERIVALLAGELDDAEADLVEEHLLDCDACTELAEHLRALGDAVRAIVRAGRIDLAATPSLIAAIEQDGVIIGRYRVGPGGSVACSIGDEAFNLVALEIDAHSGRIDLERRGPDGALMARYDDLPYAPASGVVISLARGDRLRTLPKLVMTLDLFAGERRIGTYQLDHQGRR